MLKKTLLFSFFLLSVCFLSAQKEIELSSNDSKVKKVKEILHKIQQASWEYSQDSIAIKMVESGKFREKVVDYSPKENVIWINKAVYDSIYKLGEEDAIAFLIAHEFGHYMLCKQHKQHPDFSGHTDTLLEKKADLMGNLYARLAGYKPCQYTEKIFTELYKDFFVEDSLYPVQGTRKRIAAAACAKSDTLANLFQVANTLLILQKYEEAIVLFDKLGREFPAPEMFFNAALARIGFAFEVKNEKIYRIPLLFDSRTKAEMGGVGDAYRKRRVFLQQAQKLLDTLARKSSHAFIVQIYSVYVQYSLDYELKNANKYTLPPLLPETPPHLRQLHSLMQAILLTKTDSTQATQLFKKLVTDYPVEAAWNLNVLQKNKQTTLLEPPYNGSLAEESINGKVAGNLPFSSSDKSNLKFSTDEMDILLSLKKDENALSCVVYCEETKLNLKFLQTLPHFTQKTRLGAYIGQSYAEVAQLYDAHFAANGGIVMKMEYKTLQNERVLQYGGSHGNGILLWFREGEGLYRWVVYGR